MIRIGMISYWHVHSWDYTNQALEHPGTEIVAVWDEEEQRGQAAAEKLGVTYYADLDDMLSRSDIDAVIVDAPTNRHAEVMVAAAKAGKHIFTEKVVAATLKDANLILQAIQEAGVKLTVSLPRLNDNYTLAIQEQLAAGALGQVTLVRTRLSHNGGTANWLPEHFYNLEQCEGGALIDLGCHPVYLARLFLGQLPATVSAQFGYITGREVEDNAVALLNCADGALGVAEAGFINDHSPFAIEVHGTKGTLLYGTPHNKLLIRSSIDGAAGSQDWSEIELPDNRESAFHQWVGHIEGDTVAEENIALALDLTRIMEAANRSVREKRIISINELEQ